MKKSILSIIAFGVLASPYLYAQDTFECMVLSNATSDSGEWVQLKVNAPAKDIGRSKHNKTKAGSLSLSTENVEGVQVLNLSLLTPGRVAVIASSRADLNAKTIGLVLNTSNWADILCVKE